VQRDRFLELPQREHNTTVLELGGQGPRAALICGRRGYRRRRSTCPLADRQPDISRPLRVTVVMADKPTVVVGDLTAELAGRYLRR
jgi:hypothetical protein